MCNNDCLFCSNEGERTPRTLDEVLADMGSPDGSIDSLEIVGGEPMQYEELDVVVEEARQRGWRRIKLLTNGRAFSNPQVAIDATQAGVRVFELKLAGSMPQVHEAVTRSPGSFIETAEGIVNLRNVKMPKEVKAFVGLRVPVGELNFQYVPHLAAFAVQVGVDRLTLSFDDPNARMSDVAPLLKAAIDVGLVNALWVQTEGVPLCMMGGYEHHVHEAIGTVEGQRERRDPCSSCAYTTCEGILSSYLKENSPSEFVPVLSSIHAQRMKKAAEQ